MEVGEEIHEFLETIEAGDLPVIDLDSVMEQVMSTMNDPADPKDDHSTLAIVAGYMAYGEGLHEGPYDPEYFGWSPQQKNTVFDAVMKLGWRMRYRVMDLRLIDEQHGVFSHRFKEIERDHILRLEQDQDQPDYTAPGAAPVARDWVPERHRAPTDAAHFTDHGDYHQVSTRWTYRRV
jgi:hypothetical protein